MAGMCIPDCAIRDKRPMVFRATVFPPAFAPLIMRALEYPPRWMSMGTVPSLSFI